MTKDLLNKRILKLKDCYERGLNPHAAAKEVGCDTATAYRDYVRFGYKVNFRSVPETHWRA